MMNMIDSVLEFIRSWVYPLSEEPSRKRRAPVSSPVSSPKYRKVLSPMSLNDNSFNPRSSMRCSPNNSTIILDDDRHHARLIDIKPRSHLNDIYRKSSPQFHDNYSNNDLSFNKTTKSTLEKKRDADKLNFAYITNFSKTRDPITKTFINGNNEKISPIPTKLPKIKQRLFTSPSLDFSIRLDDKRKYKELVAALSHSLNDTGGSSNLSERTRRIVSVKSPKPPVKPIEIIDLTDTDRSLITPKKLNTKDTLVQLLNHFENDENEHDIIEDVDDDSDSDVEVLPEPPSPKPDIKVDPINSFKTISIDTSKTAHKQWLDLYSEEYDRSIEDKSKVIQMYTENASQLGQINHDLLIQKLTKKINDSLTIKSTILPVIEIDEDELPQLTENQIKDIKRALNHRDPHYTLITKFNLPITVSDIRTLTGLNWLNDNVINYYMNLINQRSDNQTKYPKSYCFNTFFYPKLLNTGPSSLRRWTKKIDLFTYEFVCIPVHLSVHWCMAIINLKQKTIKYYDSMGSDNNVCLKALKNYLEYEHMDKKNQTYDTNDFRLENVKNMPQQMNGCDCGMFACTFAEFATRHAKFTFTQKDMPYLRQKMIVEILHGKLLIE